MITLGTEQFYWNAKSKEFVQEASSLREMQTFSNGFKLRSQKTGAVVDMKFVKTEFCGTVDHEVVAWHFVSTGPVAFGVVILND
jgi:hypothetical protein